MQKVKREKRVLSCEAMWSWGVLSHDAMAAGEGRVLCDDAMVQNPPHRLGTDWRTRLKTTPTFADYRQQKFFLTLRLAISSSVIFAFVQCEKGLGGNLGVLDSVAASFWEIDGSRLEPCHRLLIALLTRNCCCNYEAGIWVLSGCTSVTGWNNSWGFSWIHLKNIYCFALRCKQQPEVYVFLIIGFLK